MHAKYIAHQKAIANVSSLLDASIELPKNVFRGRWNSFFFFDADLVTDMKFVEEAKALLEIEGSQCACIVDLNMEVGSKWAEFFFDKDVSSSSYHSFLWGPSQAEGALRMTIGRYGCASDEGQWCIYCEKEAEIGIMAIRDGLTVEKYSSVLDRIGALPIVEAIAAPLSFVFGHLNKDYRTGLLENYAMPGE